MYLKKIELIGFKSFAEKTEISFDQGINAIVGPNGCGKSNVSDAVRWALGEQSIRSLRGGKMEDLIFNGTSQRHPLNYAEVSLLFDNSTPAVELQYKEIAVTRRVYRSGESEFLINNVACRLKDIADLFIDTGLGKEGYSIVGQGQIEQVLASRPEEIREMMEEAAGISKYRLRKEDALRRLQQTGQNLLRVKDLLAELEQELEPLQAEAEKAKQYLDLQYRRRSLEKGLLSRKMSQKQQEIKRLQEKYSKLEDSMQTGSRELTVREEQCSQLKLSLGLARELLETAKQRMHDVSASLNQTDSRIEMIVQQLSSQENQVLKLQQEIARLETRIKDIVIRKEDVSKQNVALATQEQELEQQQLILQQQLNVLKLDQNFKSLQGKREDYYSCRENLKLVFQQIENIQQRLAEVENEKDRLKLEIKTEATKLEDFKGIQDASNKKLKALRIRKEEQQQHQLILSSEKEKIEKELFTYTEKLKKILQLSREAEHRRNWLAEQEQQMDGYYDGVKKVMSASSVIGGVIGVVSSLFDVPEKLETAIEKALGGALQYIITEDDEAARRAVNYLKQNNFGRATFLPLATLRSRNYSWQEKKNGVLGQANELVQSEPKLKKAIDFLLGHFLVVEDMETALKAAKDIDYKWRLVTLDGDLIAPGGTITGGSKRRNFLPLLGRKREISELENSIINFRREAGDVSSKIDSINKQIDEIDIKISAVKETIEQLEKEEKELSAKNEDVSRNYILLQQSYQQKNEQYKKIFFEIEENNRGCNLLKQKEKELEDSKSIIEAELKKYEEIAAVRQQEEIQLQERYIKLQVDEGTVKEQRRSSRRQQEEYEISLQENQGRLQLIQSELNEAKKSVEMSAVKLEQLENSRKQLRIERQREILKVQNLETELNQTRQAFDQDEEKAENQRRWIKRVERRLHQSEMDLTKINMEESRLKELFAGYEDIELVELGETIEVNEVEEECSVLYRREEEMQPVNTGAIEEYRRLGERVDYLSSERDDLQAGDESLRVVIRQVEKEMETRFRGAFAQIQENFKQVFKTLFNGGRGELHITDNEDLLNGGVQILAQPPGKKLQSLSLLSGGEKTIAAIALIFALLHYRPSPICFLDEIESSLDESNLGRFLVYLQRLADRIQFILITHRRRTMEAAANLYGVTMFEPGVSQVLSVRLEDEIPQQAAGMDK